MSEQQYVDEPLVSFVSRSKYDEAIRQRDELAGNLEATRTLLDAAALEAIGRGVAERERDACRAVLAEVLDNPIPAPIQRCVFCEKYPIVGDPWVYGTTNPIYHRDDCPVLSRDRLLGRDRAPAEPEAT